MPLVARPGTATTELVSIRLPACATPLAHRLIGHDHSALYQQLFHIAKAQAEPEGEPHGVADDLDGKPVILIFLRGGQNVPAVTLLYGMEAPHVDNALG